jgi:hypothetical protein
MHEVRYNGCIEGKTTHQDARQDAHQDTMSSTQKMILAYGAVPQTRYAIAEHCGYKDRVNFTKRHLKPLLRIWVADDDNSR